MKRLWLAALLLLWPASAFADDAANAGPQEIGSHVCLREMAQWTGWAKAKSLHGIRATRLEFRIGADGAVKDLKIGISSDDPIADALAAKCVLAWRYTPAKRNGQPVEVAWNTTISMSNNQNNEPHAVEFDAVASNPASQTCDTYSAGSLEGEWTNTSGGTWSKPFAANDGFECAQLGNDDLFCRAKPGTALYPTLVTTTYYSTGARLKLGVQIDTAGECKAAMPMTFKDKLPVR